MVERIGPKEAKRRMDEDGYRYVDVRSVEEFEQGHPEGAYNVPIMLMSGGGMSPNAEFVRVMESAFGRDAKLVVGCRSGGRSLRAAEMLSAAGFGAVVDQRAGWDGARDAFGRVSEPGWAHSDLPCATEAREGRAYGDLK